MSVASPSLKIGVNSEVFHDWGTVPELKAAFKSICKHGSRRRSGAGSASVGTSEEEEEEEFYKLRSANKTDHLSMCRSRHQGSCSAVQAI